MSYAIMRIQKIKSKQALAEREKHNTRRKTVLSADGSNNITIEGHKGLVKRLEALEKQVDKNNNRKTRKDAVRVIEVIFTSDKAFFNRVDDNEYFNACKKWLESTFETESLYQYSVHRDESVSHLHCIISTLHEGKFNYAYYADNRVKLRALQDSFYESVKHFGLERGKRVEETQATYQTTKEWHKNVSKARTYAEALSESKRLEYAIKGVMFTQENEILNIENMELRSQLNESNKRYKNLKQGIFNALKGDYQNRIRNVELLERAGKNYLEMKEREVDSQKGKVNEEVAYEEL
ncbi:MobV family relaxase [Clostridium celatum]|uniref:MobV family relaxase n=1 Tax=Clostridium celatum TaxID=36834 RepID=UPI0018985B2A|nr:MobV family relaxase [Clostridium celatum]